MLAGTLDLVLLSFKTTDDTLSAAGITWSDTIIKPPIYIRSGLIKGVLQWPRIGSIKRPKREKN
jgi:hypothetical protein